MFKVSNKDAPKSGHRRRSGVLTVNFELISHIFIVFL